MHKSRRVHLVRSDHITDDHDCTDIVERDPNSQKDSSTVNHQLAGISRFVKEQNGAIAKSEYHSDQGIALKDGNQGEADRIGLKRVKV